MQQQSSREIFIRTQSLESGWRRSSGRLSRRVYGGWSGILATLCGLLLLFGLLFVPVSVTTRAMGVVSLDTPSAPIIAERAGLLSYVATVRDPVQLKAGDVVATIRNLDVATIRGGPGVAASRAQRQERLEQLQEELNETLALGDIRDAELTRQQDALEELVRQAGAVTNSLQAEIERLRALAESQSRLVERGLATVDRVLATEQLLSQVQTQSHDSRLRQLGLGAELIELQERKALATAETSQRAHQLEAEMMAVELQLQADAELERVDVLMPHDGTVTPRGYIAGQAVALGDPLFDMQTDGGAKLFELDVPGAMIGGIRVGMEARISFAAYPYLRYGTVNGTVRQIYEQPRDSAPISEDVALGQKHRVTIVPDQASLARFEQESAVFPGLEVEAHIRKDQTPLWQYLLSPVLKSMIWD